MKLSWFFSLCLSVTVVIGAAAVAVAQELSTVQDKLNTLEERLGALESAPTTASETAAQDQRASDPSGAANVQPAGNDIALLLSRLDSLDAHLIMIGRGQDVQAPSQSPSPERSVSEAPTAAIATVSEEDVSEPTAVPVTGSLISVGSPASLLEPLPAANHPFGNLEISGFFDAYGNARNAAADHTHWGLGQAEIDLASAISGKIGIAVGVVYNSDDARFGLGAATADFNLYEAEAGFLNSVNLSAGQFDVPFGIDYEIYASPDRRLVTAPRVVDITHLGWNDFGFSLGIDTRLGNWVGYVVNGFQSSAEVLDDLTASEPDTVDTSPANAFGTRLGITPLPTVDLQLGSSWALGLNHSGDIEMWLGGADFQLAAARFEFRGEYIYHSLNRSIEPASNSGYYFQGLYKLHDRAFLIGRYGSFKTEGEEWTAQVSSSIPGRMPYQFLAGDGAQWVGQLSLGAGYKLTEGVELRLETVINEDAAENQEILQLVACF